MVISISGILRQGRIELALVGRDGEKLVLSGLEALGTKDFCSLTPAHKVKETVLLKGKFRAALIVDVLKRSGCCRESRTGADLVQGHIGRIS